MHITPLMRAIYVNGARVIDKLLELGVDTNAQVEDNGNLTAGEKAAKFEEINKSSVEEIFQTLLEGYNSSTEEKKEGETKEARCLKSSQANWTKKRVPGAARR